MASAKPKLTEKLKTEAYKTKTETCKTENRGLLKQKTEAYLNRKLKNGEC